MLNVNQLSELNELNNLLIPIRVAERQVEAKLVKLQDECGKNGGHNYEEVKIYSDSTITHICKYCRFVKR